jgi:hypothetical protein
MTAMLDQYSKPTDHPLFVCCNDPRLERKYKSEPIKVHVPSLVRIVRRMGGMDRIAMELVDTRQDRLPHLKLRRWHDPIVELWGTGKNKDGTFSVFFTGWHPEDKDLDVEFHIPADWTTEVWEVGVVMDGDMFVIPGEDGDELEREIALECDRHLGKMIANDPSDPHVLWDVQKTTEWMTTIGKFDLD